MWTAGADGCKGGWVVALCCVENGAVRARIVPSARALLALPERPAVLGVDLPIGLPERAEHGGRACDRAARRLLGRPRASSVFSPPVRAALGAGSYDAAQEANRQSSREQIGLSKQSYHLIPQICALDGVLTPPRQAFAREVHPEVSFAMMNGGHGLPEGKKTPEGRAHRRALLSEAGFATPEARLPGAAPDDLLDACAACWTAGRIARGRAERLPERRPPVDATGLRMEIWV
jgi:predicted RNase H-like nuclease